MARCDVASRLIATFIWAARRRPLQNTQTCDTICSSCFAICGSVGRTSTPILVHAAAINIDVSPIRSARRTHTPRQETLSDVEGFRQFSVRFTSPLCLRPLPAVQTPAPYVRHGATDIQTYRLDVANPWLATPMRKHDVGIS